MVTTTSRVVWFAITFSFCLPIMVVMFRGEDGMSRSSWIQAGIFAVAMAVVVSVIFGKGER